MGAGIARTIRHKFPQAYIQDIQTIKGDKSKLGTYTFSVVDVTRRKKKRTSSAASGSRFGSRLGGGGGGGRGGSSDGGDENNNDNNDDEEDNDDEVVRHSFLIVNAYTQYHWKTGPGIMNADYRAIQQVFSQIATDFKGRRIGYPKIGAGLAGGDWKVISTIIDNELRGEDHTLVEFSK